MLKHSAIKAAIYIGVFVLGYTVSHLNRDPIFSEAGAYQRQNPQAHNNLIVSCPAAKSTCLEPQVQLSSAPPIDAVIPEKKIPEIVPSEITISDFDNPDEQISLTLMEQPDAFTQANEQLVEDPDPLEPIFQLTQEQQLVYIQKLVESQEDAAIVALNDLILNDNPPIQQAAIDGLISLLEMRTGHFAMIAENLGQNSVFLNEEQLQKLEKATQTTPHTLMTEVRSARR